MHYWADLQWVYGFCCYDNIAPNAKYQQVSVLALCLVVHCGNDQNCSVLPSARRSRRKARNLFSGRSLFITFRQRQQLLICSIAGRTDEPTEPDRDVDRARRKYFWNSVGWRRLTSSRRDEDSVLSSSRLVAWHSGRRTSLSCARPVPDG